MVTIEFCQQGSKRLNIAAWNIHGVRDKLSSTLIYNLIQQYDIILLSEIKTNLHFNVPGYRTVLGNHKYGNHGGVAILFRNSIYNEVNMIDKSCNEQIWFKLSFLPNILFGGCYIVPSDSSYFSPHFHANIQAMCLNHKGDSVIFGDVNARCGSKTNSLITNNSKLQYTPVDNISNANANGQSILQLCTDCDLLIMNNLKTKKEHFIGGLTFRKKKQWISELDLVIVSPRLIHSVSNLVINQNLQLPSDHALISFSIEVYSTAVSVENLYKRAKDLGGHAVGLEKIKQTTCKPIPYQRIDPQLFQSNLPENTPSELMATCDVNDLSTLFCDNIYQCVVDSRFCHDDPANSDNIHENRWKRIIDCQDDKKLWHAINWKGSYCDNSADETEKPSDTQFQKHLEDLLNPGNANTMNELEDMHTIPSIPLLDSPIGITEVDYVIQKQLKPNKSCGPDGISPGVFKLLPCSWLVLLCMILNVVFSISYPFSWSLAKLNMLFKKGNTGDCNNYRGISVINSISKLYDYILNNRLVKWYQPDREQAGAQSKRGCVEQIVTLRLLFDYCFKKQKKLYVGFVDFSKAYDRVPRGVLFRILKNLGCGVVMMAALISMYSVTRSVLGTVIITAIIGVRQGSPTSCLLFVIFVNVLIRNLKTKCHLDGFLSWLHCLMLMDDTVILATSRVTFKQKLKILEEYCDEYGMVINEDKTKCMVIHGDSFDLIPFRIGDIIMKPCTKYVYLGAIFTADGSTLSSLREHVIEKQKHLNKLIIFFFKNQDMPFLIKKKVLDAAFSAALLYSCESWLHVSVSEIQKIYHSAIKSMLGVRKTTSNILCLLELGYPPILSYIQNRQKIFFRKMITERQEMEDDPLMFAINLTKLHNPKMWQYIENILANEHLESGMSRMKSCVSTSSSTKMKTYLALNPNLSVHPVYTDMTISIPDYLRTSFSRCRLSSHRLKIETGRWARIPQELRLCMCGHIQTEEHVLIKCVLTDHIRDLFNFDTHYTDMATFFEAMSTEKDFKMIHAIMRYYE